MNANTLTPQGDLDKEFIKLLKTNSTSYGTVIDEIECTEAELSSWVKDHKSIEDQYIEAVTDFIDEKSNFQPYHDEKVWMLAEEIDGKRTAIDIDGNPIDCLDSSNWRTYKEILNYGHVRGQKTENKIFIPNVGPKWTLERVVRLFEFPFEYAEPEKVSLAEEMLLENNFGPLELDRVKKLIKNHLGLNMGAQSVMVATNSNEIQKDFRTHSELAQETAAILTEADTVSCEGSFWEYNTTTGIYEELLFKDIELKVGEAFSGQYCKRKSDYKAITSLVYDRLLDKEFFNKQPYGLACESSFYIVENGALVKKPYTKELRQRHKIPYDPSEQPSPVFDLYLGYSFYGKDMHNQINLLQEIMGGILIGCFDKIQKAILLFGSGQNGKSVFIELLENIVPKHLRSSIRPYDFKDQTYRAELAGKILNIVGELSQTKDLPDDFFKDIVSCETETSARVPYGQLFTFIPKAAQLFASNYMPQMRDHSDGFYRRWIILYFLNKIPDGSKIPHLGQKIAEEEGPQVIHWALEGARRLVANNFNLTITETHRVKMDEWKKKKDAVYAFLHDDEYVIREDGTKVLRKELYSSYTNYCTHTNIKRLGRNNFFDRCELTLSKTKSSGAWYFQDVRIVDMMDLKRKLAELQPVPPVPPHSAKREEECPKYPRRSLFPEEVPFANPKPSSA